MAGSTDINIHNVEMNHYDLSSGSIGTSGNLIENQTKN
jgi:hypothetical protein